MKKIVYSLFSFLIIGLFIPTVIAQNKQETVYTESKKKSSARSSTRTKKNETPAAVCFTENETALACIETRQPKIVQLPAQQPGKEKQVCMFLQKIDFNQSGIKTFFSHTFNRADYGSTFLPHNFFHLTQFLEYGRRTKQPHDFYDEVVRLFGQKLKSASFVNSAAFEVLLLNLNFSLPSLFPQEKVSFWQRVNDILWESFKNNFSFLKRDPLSFFETISKEIVQTVKQEVTTPDRLRGVITRFIGTGIDKLAWCPDDQLATWKSFKTIANRLALLYEKNVITDPRDLNELYWGLIERYCYFLELTASHLSLDTCLAIRADLNTTSLALFAMEEQEEGIETKKERFIQALIETEARVRMTKEGFLSELLRY